MNEIIFLLIFFLAFVLQTITGFAGTVMAMAGLSGLLIAIQNYKSIHYRELLKMSSLMLVGLLIGLKLYEILTVDVLLTIYGMIVGYYFQQSICDFEALNQYLRHL